MSVIQDFYSETQESLLLVESKSLSHQFESVFQLAIGDYLEVKRRGFWMPCRIVGVEQCYVNAGGGYTARLKVMSLRVDGRIGLGRTITICTRNPGGFRGVRHPVRLSPRAPLRKQKS